MIADLRAQEPNFSKSVDLCIIGGGAAGIAIAAALAGTRLRVCLIESGGPAYEEPTEALYAGTSLGQPVDLEDGRVRAFGGSTNHWGGRCAEFSAAEVARRPWVPNSGWPITLDELRRYYPQAWKMCGLPLDVAPPDIDAEAAEIPKYASATTAAPQIWRFAPNTGGLFRNFGQVYYDTLQAAANVDVLLHANLTQFHCDAAASHVGGIAVRSLTGVSGTVAAKHYVLCCSGIENARLLLAASPRGAVLGNAHDCVGRYFMEHARALAATLYPAERYSPIQQAFNEFTGRDGVRYQTGVVLSAQTQRDEGLLNCSAVFGYAGDPDAGTTASRDIWRNLRDGRWPGDTGTDVWNVLRDAPSVTANLIREARGRPAILPLVSAGIVVDIEQVPNPESRVTLGAKRDALGMPQSVVNWRLSELERETARRFMMHLGADFARRRVGRLRLEPWLDAGTDEWGRSIEETYHYIGTTRMSTGARDGVVDTDCRVHGVDNLYVAGSSVFPTAGHVNPTLTIVALALRLAEHLNARMSA